MTFEFIEGRHSPSSRAERGREPRHFSRFRGAWRRRAAQLSPNGEAATRARSRRRVWRVPTKETELALQGRHEQTTSFLHTPELGATAAAANDICPAIPHTWDSLPADASLMPCVPNIAL